MLSLPIISFLVPTLSILLGVLVVMSGAGAMFSIRVLRRIRAERDNLVKEKEVIFTYVQNIGETFTESDTLDVDRLMQRVLYYALRTTQTSGGAIYLLEPGEQIRARAVSGVFPPMFSFKQVEAGVDLREMTHQQREELIYQTRLAVGEGLIGQAADFGTPLLIPKAELDPRVPHYEESLLNVTSLLAVPMRFRHEVMGLVCVVNRTDGIPLSERDQSLLQALADQASLSIYYAQFREALEEKRRLEQDLQLAQRIQTGLLPRELPSIPGVTLHAFYHAALEVGGDYYDVISLQDGRVGFAVADVSGKGVGGALMTAICRSVLRAHAGQHLDPATVLREVNQTMTGDLYEDMFVTMLYMVYDPNTRMLSMARAGHDPAFMLYQGDDHVRTVDSGGMAIGLIEGELFGEIIETVELTLEPGESVLVYTDGITEAMNAGEKEWGKEALATAMVESQGGTPESMGRHIREQVMEFVGDTPQSDDMTMLILKVD